MNPLSHLDAMLSKYQSVFKYNNNNNNFNQFQTFVRGLNLYPLSWNDDTDISINKTSNNLLDWTEVSISVANGV